MHFPGLSQWAYIGMAVFCARVPLMAQGITTAAIGGTVRTHDGAGVEGAIVRVVNQATGVASQVTARRAVFLISGLETGGPYSVEVRRIGYEPQRRAGIVLALGTRNEIAFVLAPAATRLDPISIAAPAAVRGATFIADSGLRQLPTLNGDLYDFVRLTPQVGTRFGLSGAGTSFRLNSYVVDGVSDRVLQNNNTPARNISLDAVKEYQVHVSPFDPRYGDFAGLLVNTVTKSGTNTLHGSAYGYLRNAQLARSGSFVGTSAYSRGLYGFSVGGPIVRDRVHFFLAPEVQRGYAPARGPYVGRGGSDATSGVPAPADSVNRFASLLSERGFDAGDGRRVMNPNHSATIFARADIALPEFQSRLVVRGNYNNQDFSQFERRDGSTVFALSSAAGGVRTSKQTIAAQLFTPLSSSLFNEFGAAWTSHSIGGRPMTPMPLITVTSVGKATLSAGPGLGGQGSGSQGVSTQIDDHLVLLLSRRHTLRFGVHVEFFRYYIRGVRAGYGSWTFANLDSLEAGAASRFTIGRDIGGAAAPVVGAHPSAYLSDEWQANDGLSLTLGLRADGIAFSTRPKYNPEVDSIFHRRTSDFPVFRPQWSPRIGFTWEPGDDGTTTVRGGVGVFVGRPPLGWLVNPMRSYGSGVQNVTCSGGNVPAFTPFPASPTSCTNGLGMFNGSVTLVDRQLRMAESFRALFAIDRQLPWSMTGTVEGLYSKARADFMFRNAKLAGPVGTDAQGRVLYGTFSANGAAQPDTVRGNTFSDVIDLRNRSGGYSWSVTTSVEKPWSDRLGMRASYTHSRVRDVESITSSSVGVPSEIWAAERPSSGRRDDQTLGISSFDIPHRVVIAATWVASWRGQRTDISLYYVGESGVPFTYGDSTPAATAALSGDLNANGTAADDPIYVPRDATDPTEIVFADSDFAAQGAAFEQFIRGTPCLTRQRGRIMERNSCRTAWVHTSNLSVRQALPRLGGRSATLQLDVFNVFNLLNKSWGLYDTPSPWILRYAGRTAGALPQATFRFEQPSRTFQNLESSYQLQLSLRYSF